MSTGINIVPSSGITVGTTPSTGVDTRVFFQAGGVVQQDANFTFDNTLKRLTLKAVGTAATDIPFQIKNSAGTQNLLQVSGTAITLNGSGGTAFTPCIDLQRNGSSIFFIDEYAAKFNGPAYFSSIVGYGSTAISVSSQSGPAGQAITLYPASSGLSLGYSSTAARLDVRAQGALSTDIAFRVRNSADSQNIISVLGNGNTVFNNQTLGSTYLTIGQIGAGNSSDCFLDFASGRGIRSRYGGVVQTGIRLFYNSTSRNVGFYVSSSEASDTIFFDGGQNIRIGQGYSNTNQPDANATRTIQQMTGVAPTTSVADGFQQYSADITAGNAAPHFRTENGAVVKVYQETTAVVAAAFVANTSAIVDDTATFGGYTMGQVVAALKAQGLLA